MLQLIPLERPMIRFDTILFVQYRDLPGLLTWIP